MKGGVLVLALACVAMWGQDRKVVVIPNTLPNQDQLKSFEDAFHRGKTIVVPRLDLLATTPDAQTCAVPLLVVPVNPDLDRKMVVHPPRSAFENAGIVKGMPACERHPAE